MQMMVLFAMQSLHSLGQTGHHRSQGWDAGRDGRCSEGEGSCAAFLNNIVTLGQCPGQGLLGPCCPKPPTHPAALPWEWHNAF